MITGKPIFFASFIASSADSIGSGDPGRIGTPAAVMVRRASTLSPIILMTSGLGPMNLMLQSSQIFAKVSDSARNPYPG